MPLHSVLSFSIVGGKLKAAFNPTGPYGGATGNGLMLSNYDQFARTHLGTIAAVGGTNPATTPPGTHWYLGIYPVPATTGTFTLYYYRKARNATGTTTTLDVTVGYEDIPLWYAVYMAKYRDRDPTWQTAKAQYDAMLVKMIDNTSRFTDESSQFVDTSNAQWPVYLYSESGSGF